MRRRGGMVCILLATPGMSPVAAVALMLLALDPSDPPSSHVRPDAALRPFVQESARRSPSIRELLDRLERTDVIVYVRTRVFNQTALEGRIGILTTAADGQRYLLIELACGRPGVSTMATLGHELYHALEIAEAPSIVDARTLAAFYRQHGMETSGMAGQLTFETDAAAQAGRRAWRELWDNTRETWTLK